ncbi:LysR family transcriptional regulator [Providencia alcalifaciens]|uniref:LysR substrate binding domain protein n=2 Tax=Enterobacterales TaxID=91347 RepID=B6XHR6_9GAMM|nr:LysR family transcriptional regulator [Providencia alcalifaciens]ATG17492.1 LysR family transcriptional regulator [Providencia alcalifaciens]EEB44879.1 LysR substrate binding domain protein [Providencia alcalifaciens DSM 30120]MTC28180.1 LysR family transcriptional regulator [Providencia alcalifaciens]MTC54503.1 LysR family transcriptional regulator [Providencia alcalifaciens]SPY74042.1 HTH-type transcriptional regulator gltC [Providencia alcalifaciens]
MTLSQLEIFTLVAELKSFTLAAMSLKISQSAVSHAIKSLEKDLNVILFTREQNQITLTEIGCTLLNRAQHILSLQETMRQEAQASNGLKKGVLRIGSFGPGSSTNILPPLLTAFRQQYPDIQIIVDEGDDESVTQWLQEKRVDVGVVVLPDERFDTFLVKQDQYVAILPLNHPLAIHEGLTLKQLCNYPFNLTQAGSGKVVMSLFSAQKLTPKIQFRTRQLLSTFSLVARGEAVSIVAQLAIPENINNIVVKPLIPRVTRDIAFAVNNLSDASPATKAFIKLVKSCHRD